MTVQKGRDRFEWAPLVLLVAAIATWRSSQQATESSLAQLPKANGAASGKRAAISFVSIGLLLITIPTISVWQLFRDASVQFNGSIRVVSFLDDQNDQTGTIAPPPLRVSVAGPGSGRPYAELLLRASCGAGRTAGALILQGDARMTSTKVDTLGTGFETELIEVAHTDPSLNDELVQIAAFEIESRTCPDTVDPGQFAEGHGFAGNMRADVAEQQGSRSSAAGPSLRVGDFEDLETVQNALPDRRVAVVGPIDFDLSIDAFLAPTDQVVGSPPGLTSTAPLAWSGRWQLSPAATWENVEAEESRALSTLLVGVAVGVGASMLATGAFSLLTQPLRRQSCEP